MELQWIEFPDDRFKVHGLAWWSENKPSLSRLPTRLKDTFRPPVWDLAQCPAGGRIRFKTDSTTIGFRAKAPDNSVMHHITLVGEAGFDIYVDGYFMGSLWPNATGEMQAAWRIGKERKLRDITIHMPLYKPTTISQIGVEEDSRIEAPAPFALKKPVVYYGSSITQGGCASTPGTTYQDFISRWLNVDFINLGFSGNGQGEPELAAAINEIDSSCIVVDHWANIGLKLEENLPVFVGALREAQKDVPILVVGPFYFCSEDYESSINPIQRKVARDFVKKQRAAGDANIHYVDGLKMVSKDQSFGLVDGAHCNSLGFYFCAKGLAPYLKRILKL